MYDAEKVCALNDAFRKSLAGGKVVITQGVAALPDIVAILNRVREFSEFDPGNNPYRENDFGALTEGGHQLFWKIDYYDLDLNQGSPDPSDTTVTTRVLTVMLAEEY